MKKVFAALRGALGRAGLPADESGTVAVLFALAVAPMTFLVGSAVDYSGAANLKTFLQKATDGTSLRLCQVPNNPTKTQLEDVAAKMMSEYFGQKPYTIEDLRITQNPRSIELATKAVYATAIVKAMGPKFATLPVTAFAKCFGEPQTYEIALVLDTTGSMNNRTGGGSSKLQAMKQAATSFVDYIFSDPAMSSGSRMSLVPFAATVAVDQATYRNASWIDQGGNSAYHWTIVRDTPAMIKAAGVQNRFAGLDFLRNKVSSWGWNGCFESLPYPLNTQDVSPTPSNPDSYFVPMWAVDESGGGGERRTSTDSFNSYIDDWTGTSFCPSSSNEAVRTGQGCKYINSSNPSTSNSKEVTGPNVTCTSRRLTRMTATKKTLTDEIALLQALGYTNIHEGFMWGWRTISPLGIFKDGTADQKPSAYGKAYNNKVIVLMTDGMNTWRASPKNYLKSFHSAYGYIMNPNGTGPNGRLPPANANPTNDTQTRAAIDALTLAACANARAAGITVYTIGFNGTFDPIDQQGLNMLRDCAGDTSRAFVANDANSLVGVFQQIASSIGSLRLAR